MSEDNEVLCCASCGIAEIDDIKLVPCDGCDLVKYCSDDCQHNHKAEHEEACKKRAAELRDELLFKQPESTHFGDCPICSLPLPLDERKSALTGCCSKVICHGCVHANVEREKEMRLEHTCPFCRESANTTEEEAEKMRMKRIAANDPGAIRKEGGEQYLKGNYSEAFEYFTNAAESGDAFAHFKLSMLYQTGEGVEKDRGEEIYHLEEAAIGGHPYARYNLGAYEWINKRNTARAVKHFIIAAKQGHDHAIKMLMKLFQGGYVGKEELAAALRAHKAAVDEMKSPQREATDEFYQKN